jgi:hypothetical protein
MEPLAARILDRSDNTAITTVGSMVSRSPIPENKPRHAYVVVTVKTSLIYITTVVAHSQTVFADIHGRLRKPGTITTSNALRQGKAN